MEEMIINKEKFKYSYFGTVLANIIKENNLLDTIIPFPNEITFRFGAKYTKKYYLTDMNFIKKNLYNIYKNKKKLIILYGSKGFYYKPINDNTMLYYMIKYANNL